MKPRFPNPLGCGCYHPLSGIIIRNESFLDLQKPSIRMETSFKTLQTFLVFLA